MIDIKDGNSVDRIIKSTGAGTAGDPFIPVQDISTTGPQKIRLDRFLDTNGDGSGANLVTGDYSSAEEIFYIQPSAGEAFRVARIIIYIEDTGSFDSGSYGNGLALANGIQVRVQNDGGTIADMTAGLPVKTNTQWGRMCYDIKTSNFGSGNEAMGVRWTFTAGGQFVRLDGDNNERLEVVVNDDFSSLVDHSFLVQGFIE